MGRSVLIDLKVRQEKMNEYQFPRTDPLTDPFITYNRNGLDFIWSQTKQAIAKVDRALMKRLVSVLEHEFPNRAEAFMARAQLKRAIGDLKASNALARESLESEPNY